MPPWPTALKWFCIQCIHTGRTTSKRLGIQLLNNTMILAGACWKHGVSDEQIEAANEYICGTMTVEGAPYLKEEHLPVFDCANKCGQKGERYIHAHGHIRMMAAAAILKRRYPKPSTCPTRLPGWNCRLLPHELGAGFKSMCIVPWWFQTEPAAEQQIRQKKKRRR